MIRVKDEPLPPMRFKRKGAATNGAAHEAKLEAARNLVLSREERAQRKRGRKRRDPAVKTDRHEAERTQIIVRMKQGLANKLEKERSKRGLRSRNDCILALLEEGVG